MVIADLRVEKVDGYLIASDLPASRLASSVNSPRKNSWKSIPEQCFRKVLRVFMHVEGSKNPTVDFKCDEGLKKIEICEVIDIEEMTWTQSMD